jgi:hypothetical protein
LIDIVLKNRLIPENMQAFFSGLISTLKSGVPTIRNNFGAHGKGIEDKSVPDYLVSYTLHLTGSAILFLMNANKHFSESDGVEVSTPDGRQ